MQEQLNAAAIVPALCGIEFQRAKQCAEQFSRGAGAPQCVLLLSFVPADGPDEAAETHTGLGTRIIETLARQINAAVSKERVAPGNKVTITVPRNTAT